MTTRVPEIVSADCIIVTIMGNAMPPRDPNDDDDEDEDEEAPNQTTTSSPRSSENPTNSSARVLTFVRGAGARILDPAGSH